MVDKFIYLFIHYFQYAITVVNRSITFGVNFNTEFLLDIR